MESSAQGSSRYSHYAIDLKRYYRLPAVQASLSTVLSLLIVAFFIIAAIRPTFVTITKLKRTIEESDKTLHDLKAKEAAIQQAAAVWEKLKDKAVYVNASVPDKSANYNLFIKSLEYMANQTGVNITSETLGSSLLYSELISPYTGRERNVISMPISIRITGSYEAVVEFYRQLSTMDRIMDIDSISFINDTSNKNKGSLIALSVNGSIGYLANDRLLKSVFESKDK